MFPAKNHLPFANQQQQGQNPLPDVSQEQQNGVEIQHGNRSSSTANEHQQLPPSRDTTGILGNFALLNTYDKIVKYHDTSRSSRDSGDRDNNDTRKNTPQNSNFSGGSIVTDRTKAKAFIAESANRDCVFDSAKTSSPPPQQQQQQQQKWTSTDIKNDKDNNSARRAGHDDDDDNDVVAVVVDNSCKDQNESLALLRLFNLIKNSSRNKNYLDVRPQKNTSPPDAPLLNSPINGNTKSSVCPDDDDDDDILFSENVKPLPQSRDTTTVVVSSVRRQNNINNHNNNKIKKSSILWKCQENSENENNQPSGFRNVTSSAPTHAFSRSHDSNSVDLNENKMTPGAAHDAGNNNNGLTYVNHRETLPPAASDSLPRGANSESANHNHDEMIKTRKNTSPTDVSSLHSPPGDNTKNSNRGKAASVRHLPFDEQYEEETGKEMEHSASRYPFPIVERSLFRSAFVASVAPVSGAYLERISTNVIRSVCRKLLQVSVKPLFTGKIDSKNNNNNNNNNIQKKNEYLSLNVDKKSRPLGEHSPLDVVASRSSPNAKRQLSSVNNNEPNKPSNALVSKDQQSKEGAKLQQDPAFTNPIHHQQKNQLATVGLSNLARAKKAVLNKTLHKFATSASALRLSSTVERLARVLTMVPKNWILVTAPAASSMATTATGAQQQHHQFPSLPNNGSHSINHTNGASVLLASVLPHSNSVVVVREEPVIEAKILTVATSTPNTSLATTSRLFAPQDDDLPATATCKLAGLRDLLKARSLRFLNSNENARKNNHNSCGSMIASVVSLPGLPLLPLVDDFAESCNEGKSNKSSPLDDDSTKQPQQQLKRPNNATTLAVDDIHLKEFVELGSPSGLNSFLGASPSVFDLTDAAMKDYLHTARYPGTFRPVATLGAGAFGTAYLVVYKEKQDVIERQAKDLEFRASHAITEEFYLSSTVFSSPQQQLQQLQDSQRLHTNSLSHKNTANLTFGSFNNKVVGQSSVADEPITNFMFSAGAAAIAFENDAVENNTGGNRNHGENIDNNNKSEAKHRINFRSDATPANQRQKQPRKNASNVSFLFDQRKESALLETATNATADAPNSDAFLQMPSFNAPPIQRCRYDHISNTNNNNSYIVDIVEKLPRLVPPPGRFAMMNLSAPSFRPSQSHIRDNNPNNNNDEDDDAILPPPRVGMANGSNVAASNFSAQHDISGTGDNVHGNSKSRSVNMIGRTSPSSPKFSNCETKNNNNRRERQQPVWKTRNPLTKKSIVPVGGPAGCGSGMSCTTLNVTVTMMKQTSVSGAAAAATSTPTRQSNNTKNNSNIYRALTIPREQIFVCKVEKLPDAQSLEKKKKATDIKSKMPWDSDIHIDPGENDDDEKNKNKNPSPSSAAEIAKQRLERMRNESHILANIAHPNIVGYVDYFFDKKANRQLLFLEYVDGGDLEKEIERRRKNVPKLYFSLETVLHIFVQVVLAVEYLHRHNILHRDIKSQNILLSKFLFVKLTDFGTARQFDQDVDQNVECGIAGSPLFMCAARLNGAYYSQKSEMWSLGVLLYELLSFEYPFMSNDIRELMSMIENAEPRPLRRQGEHVPVELFRVLESLLQKNADDRPTAKQVLTQHPIIAKAVRGYENRLQKFTESSDVSTPADRAWLGVLRDHIRAVYEDHPISMSSQQSRVQDSVARGDLSRTRSGHGVGYGSGALGGNASFVSRGESSSQQHQEQQSCQNNIKRSVSASGKLLNRISSISNSNGKNYSGNNNNNNNKAHNIIHHHHHNEDDGDGDLQSPRRPILMQVLQPVNSVEAWSGGGTPPTNNENNNKQANSKSPPVSSSSSRRLVSMILARRGNGDDGANDKGEWSDDH